MNAICINEFVKNLDELESTKVPLPQDGPSDSLLVRITHAAVTHVDLLYAQGLHQNNRRHVKPPFILGTEFAGVVAESPKSSSFPVGTRVSGVGLGSFAQFIRVSETSVRRVPPQWTNAGACAVGISGPVSYGGLQAARVKSGETVLVLGATGGLGAMACQIAKAMGCFVIAVAGSQAKAQKAREWGADEVVDYHDKDWEAQVIRLCPDDEGVDVVYDTIGAVQSSIRTLKYGGRVVIVGFAARGGNMEELKMNRILLKGVTVVGYRFGEGSRRSPREAEATWNEFMRLSETGKITPAICDQKYEGLESVPRALKDAEARSTWGRAVIEVDGSDSVSNSSKL